MSNLNMQNSIDNLTNEVKKLVLFLDKIDNSIKLDGHRDDDRMLGTFYKRQINHLNSLILLKNHCDIQLIARSMFEASVYLSYSLKDKNALARWSFYAEKIDNDRFEELSNKEREQIINMSEEEKIENGIPLSLGKFSNRFKELFFKNDVFNEKEYGYSWLGRSITIKKLTIDCDKYYNLDFYHKTYKEYYSILSSYHHWDVRAVANRYKLDKFETNFIRIADNNEILYYRLLSFCLALSSISGMVDLILKYRINSQEYKNEWENIKKVLMRVQGVSVSEHKLNIKDKK